MLKIGQGANPLLDFRRINHFFDARINNKHPFHKSAQNFENFADNQIDFILSELRENW